MSIITHPVELPETLYRKLEDKAINEGASLAELVEKVLSEYVELPVFASTSNGKGRQPVQTELTPEEKEQNRLAFAGLEKLAHQIGQDLGGRPVDVVAILREERS